MSMEGIGHAAQRFQHNPLIVCCRSIQCSLGSTPLCWQPSIEQGLTQLACHAPDRSSATKQSRCGQCLTAQIGAEIELGVLTCVGRTEFAMGCAQSRLGSLNIGTLSRPFRGD